MSKCRAGFLHFWQNPNFGVNVLTSNYSGFPGETPVVVVVVVFFFFPVQSQIALKLVRHKPKVNQSAHVAW